MHEYGEYAPQNHSSLFAINGIGLWRGTDTYGCGRRPSYYLRHGEFLERVVDASVVDIASAALGIDSDAVGPCCDGDSAALLGGRRRNRMS